MTLLVAGALALLVIYAGVKLLIQTQKEALGNRYKCAAWFFIIAGFLIIGCAGICCIVMCSRYGTRMMEKDHKMMRMHHKMMEEYQDGAYGHMDFMEHKKMMKYGHGMHSDGCNIYINSRGEDEEMESCAKMCKTDSMCKKK